MNQALSHSDFNSRILSFCKSTLDPRLWFLTYGNLVEYQNILHSNATTEHPKKGLAARALATSVNATYYEYFHKCMPHEAINLSSIPWPFRISTFLPVNTLIAWSLIFTPKIPGLPISEGSRATVYNLLNRGYCITLDWYNRNPSADIEDYASRFNIDRANHCEKVLAYTSAKHDSYRRYLKSFALATASSLSMLWVGRYMGKAIASRFSPNTTVRAVCREISLKFLPPSFALTSGHICDILFMREKEWREGIILKDSNNQAVLNEKGEPMLSRKAGQKAVFQVALQRILNANIVLLLPPMIAAIVLSNLKRGLTTTSKNLLHLGIISSVLCTAVPVTQAISPKLGTVRCGDLEKDFQDRFEKGTLFIFDRGL